MGRYHFIAIGGIGMSGLAKYLIEDGNTVSGSDIENSKYIEALRNLGATVYIGHNADNVPNNATVIVSTAIRESNPELIKAKELGLKLYHRSDLLKEIAENAQNNGKCFIGFSGTHGKTTTGGLASYLLDKSGYEPSFVVGGIIPELYTNSQHKNGKYFVAELDESDGTISKYSPDILVINNLEEDHLDYYKNGLSDLISTFQKTVNKSGKVIVNTDNSGCQKLGENLITFGINNNADYMAKNIVYTDEGTSFDVYRNEKLFTNIFTPLCGIHNVYNNLAVIAAFSEAGIDDFSSIKEYCAQFSGMGRRFQKVCEFDGIQVYDDYAHHPTEIAATLSAAAQKFGKDNIVAVFQPHRYTRLKGLWNEFKTAFVNSSRVIVTDVYAASEDVIEGISGENFAKDLEGAEYVSGSIEEVGQKILPSLKSGDIVIGLGAGTITNLGKSFKTTVSAK